MNKDIEITVVSGDMDDENIVVDVCDGVGLLFKIRDIAALYSVGKHRYGTTRMFRVCHNGEDVDSRYIRNNFSRISSLTIDGRVPA